ncbi:MAG: hypothetical protein AAGA48_24060 [Myxococcota bacterium]
MVRSMWWVLSLGLMGCLEPAIGQPCTLHDDCGLALFCAIGEAGADDGDVEGVCAAPEQASEDDLMRLKRMIDKRSQMYD